MPKQLGQRIISGPLHQALRDHIADEGVAETLPFRPNSRLRKYSLTEKARTLLGGKVLSLPLTFRNHSFQSATALKPMNPTRLKTSQDVGMT